MNVQDIARATALLEDSLLQPEDLPMTLERAGREIGFDHFCLVHSELETPTFIASEQTLEALNAYTAGGWLDVDYRAANVNRTPNGELFLDHVAVPDAQRLKSAIYNELYVPHDMAYFAGWRFRVGGATWIYSLARAEDKGPVRRAEANALARLAPAANRVLSIAHRLREMRVQGMLDGLASAELAAIILDDKGRVRVATPQAEAMFDAGFGVRNGRLWAAHGASLGDLNMLAALARNRGSPGATPNIVIRRQNGQRPILIQPVPIRGVGLDVLPGARMLLTLVDLDRDANAAAEDLRQVFDLSNAESEVASLIGLGLDPSEIANRRDVGVETVRAQLKSVFRKLDVNRQSDLARLIARMGVARPNRDGDKPR